MVYFFLVRRLLMARRPRLVAIRMLVIVSVVVSLDLLDLLMMVMWSMIVLGLLVKCIFVVAVGSVDCIDVVNLVSDRGRIMLIWLSLILLLRWATRAKLHVGLLQGRVWCSVVAMVLC